MEVYTSDSSDSDSREMKTLDLSRLNIKLEHLEEHVMATFNTSRQLLDIETVLLNNNVISQLPVIIKQFANLKVLDLSSNRLSCVPDSILTQCPLSSLILKNNRLTDKSLPKTFHSRIGALKELNLSGNLLEHFPEQVLELRSLKYLYLGGNHIRHVSKDIWKMQGLQLLSLGGNMLTEVPETVGNLYALQALVLCNNHIEHLPASIAGLKNLKSLLLHHNRLRHLPREIITLQNLTELSLRENPLVVRFVQDMALNPPTLMELAARVVKVSAVRFTSYDLPQTVINYLTSANCCVNPKCKGVFFDNRVEHIKFVDFCGKYRVPLLQYLCSSKCITTESNQSDAREAGASGYMMQKVLLG